MENNVEKNIPGKNGGMLNNGGTPGNKGGGRPKDELRRMTLDGYELALERVIKRLREDDLTPEQEASILDKLGKFGIGTKQEVETVVKDHQILENVAATVAEMFGDDKVDEFMGTLRAKSKPE